MAGTDPGALPTGPPASRAGFRGIGDPYQAYQSKRRQEALLRQKAARLQSANRARCIALETPDSQVHTLFAYCNRSLLASPLTWKADPSLSGWRRRGGASSQRGCRDARKHGPKSCGRGWCSCASANPSHSVPAAAVRGQGLRPGAHAAGVADGCAPRPAYKLVRRRRRRSGRPCGASGRG